KLLVDGHASLNVLRRFFRMLPSPPRCKECSSPFHGPGGVVARRFGFRPSTMNPNFCNYCVSSMPIGGIETDVAVMFADVRGSTEMAERMGATEFRHQLNRFYNTATGVLLQHDALIDKLIGDEVMALFIPGFAGKNYRRRAVQAGEHLLRAVGNAPGERAWLDIGVGIHAGPAFVGNVGGEGITDFTALGDTVNTASRLQALAQPGQLVMSEEAYASVHDLHPQLEAQTFDLRGKGESVTARVLTLAQPADAPAA
ncbi:MAG TPA: adenylate/guanylate cyclase domain-containing protein, partial [Dehalococcoidia bacterium]